MNASTLRVFSPSLAKISKLQSRFAATSFKENFQHGYKMKAWCVHSYGENLQQNDVRIPILSNPNEVMVKVDAASVNPIDKLILGKYVDIFFKIWICHSQEFVCYCIYLGF